MKELLKNSCITFVLMFCMIDVEWFYEMIEAILPVYGPALAQVATLYFIAVMITASFTYIKSLLNFKKMRLFVKLITLKLQKSKETA